MVRTVRHEVWGGESVLIYPDCRMTIERDVTIIDDWRETIFGPVNFGEVIMGPQRWITTPNKKPPGANRTALQSGDKVRSAEE